MLRPVFLFPLFSLLPNLSPLAHAQEQSGLQKHVQQTFQPRAGWHLVNGAWVQASGACEWHDLIRLAWKDDSFDIDVVPAPAALSMLRGHRRAAIEIGPAKDLYDATLQILPQPQMQNARNRNKIGMYLVVRAMHEWDHDGIDGIEGEAQPQPDSPASAPPIIPTFRPMTLIAEPGAVHVEGRGLLRGKVTAVKFTCTPRSKIALLEITSDDPKIAGITLREETLAGLISQHPVELRRFLSPLLQPLADPNVADLLGPGATDVYLAFPEIAPTPDAFARVREILPRLLDPDDRARSAAMETLRAIGSPGTCAIARLPIQQLAPQQRLMIEELLRDQSRRGMHNIEALRRDPMFLIDCLEFPDAGVRAAAIGEIKIRKENRPSPPVDPRNADACRRVADTLREQAFASRK